MNYILNLIIKFLGSLFFELQKNNQRMLYRIYLFIFRMFLLTREKTTEHVERQVNKAKFSIENTLYTSCSQLVCR